MQPEATIPVDDDIIDLILTLLPDLKSLHSCILVSTAFYRVFARHPKSILHTVATNKIGPIDAALDFLLFQAPEYSFFERSPGEDSALKFPVHPFLIVPKVLKKHEYSTLPWNEMNHKSLEALGTLVDQWEADFYLKWKDISGVTQLSPIESFRFRRACCRLALFGKAYDYAFPARYLELKSYLLPSHSEMRQMFEARVNFLDQFSTKELHELRVVAKYMSEILKTPVVHLLPEEKLFEVPIRVFREIQPKYGPPRRLLDALPGPLFQTSLVKKYFFSPLETILTKRGSTLLSIDDKFRGYILDERRFVRKDPCSHCGTVKQLWDHTNWNVFQNFLRSTDSRPSSGWIPKRLGANMAYRVSLRTYATGSETDLPTYFSEAFTHKSSTGFFAQWTMEQGTCEECLRKIVWDSFPRVWRARLLAYGVTLPLKDCPYGWNCWEQTKSQDHASRLNHFCRPTRGKQAPLL